MRILVTAGSTRCPIDRVRAITNIFKGRTGFGIATEAVCRGHSVTLIANPIAEEWWNRSSLYEEERERFNIVKFNTFDELEIQLRTQLSQHSWDAVIQSAAVSDYKVDSIFSDAESVYNYVKFGYNDSIYEGPATGKIESKMDEMYLRLVPTYKLVDQIRSWGLGDGKLVKFKLEVGLNQDKLFDRAKESCKESNADLIVANCLDDFKDWDMPSTQIIDRENHVTMVSRKELPKMLLNALEKENGKPLQNTTS